MTLLKQAFHSIFSLVFPNQCKACYTDLVSTEQYVCIECWNIMPRTGFEQYPNNDVAKKLHGKFYFEKAAAVYYFNKVSGIQNLLHEVKYKQHQELGIELGQKMAHALADFNWLSGIDVLLPIPLSDSKIKQRGYNQSELLAQGIAQVTQIPIDPQSIIRKKNTESQTKKNIQQRLENVKEAFEVTSIDSFYGKHILIIDDVITTGATIESCAREILKVPETKVSVLTLAYAVD